MTLTMPTLGYACGFRYKPRDLPPDAMAVLGQVHLEDIARRITDSAHAACCGCDEVGVIVSDEKPRVVFEAEASSSARGHNAYWIGFPGEEAIGIALMTPKVADALRDRLAKWVRNGS